MTENFLELIKDPIHKSIKFKNSRERGKQVGSWRKITNISSTNEPKNKYREDQKPKADHLKKLIKLTDI